MYKKYTKNVTFICYRSLNTSMEEEPKSMIVEALGGPPWAKVWDYFITFREMDHTRYHVADTTGVARLTIEKIWKKLLKLRFIIPTRKIGKAEYFRLNMKNSTVIAMIKMTNEITRIAAYKEIAEIEAQPIPVRGYR